MRIDMDEDRMTKTLTFLTTLAFTSNAFAHAGHVEHSGGHDHWSLVAGIALIAVAIAAPLIVRNLRKTEN